MKTLYDFVKKYGNEELNLNTFCEIDTLVFSGISYMDISHYIKDGESMNFYDLFSLENSKTLCKTCWIPNADKKLIKILSGTSRYKNIVVRRPHEVFSNEISTQFFAVEFSIPGVVTFVLFRGTDKTFLGCVEDIRFALDEDVESVKMAKDYVETTLSTSPDPVVLIGHSKGGTVAELCYLRLDEEKRRRVLKAYNLDGPGTKYGTEPDMLVEASNKIVKFITKRSVFGILLKTTYPHRFINGKSFWLTHHLVYNWEVKDRSLVDLPRACKKSYRRRKCADSFIFKRTNDELRAIVNDVELVMAKSDLFFIKDIKVIRLIKAWWQIVKLLFNKKRGKEDIKFLLMCIGTFL